MTKYWRGRCCLCLCRFYRRELDKKEEWNPGRTRYFFPALLLFGWWQNCSEKKEEQSSTEWKRRESLSTCHQQTYASVSLIPLLVLLGSAGGSRASLTGGEPHVHLKKLQKAMEGSKNKDGNWIFLGYFVSWIGRSIGEAHPTSSERNSLMHHEMHFSSFCPHCTSKKISVGELQKDHHHPPRILDMTTTYQNCENSGSWQGKRRKHWQKRSEISDLKAPEDMYVPLFTHLFPKTKHWLKIKNVCPLITQKSSTDSPDIIPL